MPDIGKKIKDVVTALPEGVKLVAVSKFHPVSSLKEAYEAGQRIFGESRVQELMQKCGEMPADVEWHFIGHLQTNKVRQVVPLVSLIHSADSLKLLKCLNDEAKRIGKVVNVLLQLHVAQEETKYGFACDECVEMAEAGVFAELENVCVCGVMGMATNTDDDDAVRDEFKAIKAVYDRLKQGVMAENTYFTEVSMGMSDDYGIAIEEGSTLVRIGSSIFGERSY